VRAKTNTTMLLYMVPSIAVGLVASFRRSQHLNPMFIRERDSQ
jgi:hypothetical protein